MGHPLFTIPLRSHSSMLKIGFAVCFACAFAKLMPYVQTDSPSAVNAEEYAVYSAFINQEYIQPELRPGFTLRGEITERFGPDKIEEVLIQPQTFPAPPYWGITEGNTSTSITQKQLRETLPAIAQEAFDDYLSTADSYPLGSKFNLHVKYSLVSKLESEERANSATIDTFIDRFSARHPNSLGYLFLSRVGFNASRTLAVLAHSQTDFDLRSHAERGWSGVVVLSKDGDNWTVQEVIPIGAVIKKRLNVDLAQCCSAGFGLTWAMGSANVSVKGREGDDCVIGHMAEVEGGYARWECHVPVSLGKLTIYQRTRDFYYSVDLSKDCRVIKSGNLLLEALPKK
jgi:hypothetical protein